MVSLSTLTSRCRTLFDAESGGSSVRYTDEDIRDFANEGLQTLAEATGFYERYVTIPVEANRQYYDLRGFTPEVVVRIRSIWSTAREDWLTPKDPRSFDVSWETAVGTPTHYWTRGIFWLGVYPKSDGNSAGYLRVYFSGVPSNFTHTQAVLGDLPDNYYPALEEYVLYDMCANDGRPKQAIAHFQRYMGREKALRNRVDRRIEPSTSGCIGGLGDRA